MAILFFDIGATIADVKVDAEGSFTFISRARIFEVLDGLADVRRKGVISNVGVGDAVCERATAALAEKFGAYFDDPLLVHWGSKNNPNIFEDAVASTNAAAAECVFIGESPDERMLAREAGLRTAPHPVFARAAVENRLVFWLRIDISEGRSLAELEVIANANEVVPVHVPSARLVLAMATAYGVSALEQHGFTVDLRSTVEDTSAYLIRDDRVVIASAPSFDAGLKDQAAKARIHAEATFAYISNELEGFTATVTSLGPGPGGVYVAVAAGTPIEELHIPGAKHGHTERLLPDPALLSRPGEAQALELVNGFAPGEPSDMTLEAVRMSITSAVIRAHVARLSGADPLEYGKPYRVRSRDVGSEDNMLVVDALVRRFRELGLAVQHQEFSFRGKRLANVEAEYSVIDSDTVVLITAHLDSTAAEGEYFDSNGVPRRYDPAIDPAPGADDDASGVAAVLAAAECLSMILNAGRKPARTIRFVLFNAEEQGLVGSKVYARAAAGAGDRIAAVLQMDMIGGYQGGAHKVEIHAGSAIEGAVVRASNMLGDIVAVSVKALAPSFEIERITGPADPAAGRSDHASFHERGWAAVAVSENFFADTAPASGSRQYHRPGDTLNDLDHNTDYAAEIARAVATTALTLVGL
ncbi:Zn-dependent exopeptidase M28 [Pseudomonas sp. LLC-1]|nr:Zn-dependent exopeptidase M28 [Pseudomonas sp. LLC-1]